jgi:hypothetical protein
MNGRVDELGLRFPDGRVRLSGSCWSWFDALQGLRTVVDVDVVTDVVLLESESSSSCIRTSALSLVGASVRRWFACFRTSSRSTDGL